MKNFILCLALIFTTNAFSKTEKWAIDSAHTKIGFEISHLIISSVEGKFNSFSGELDFDIKDPKKSVKEFKFAVSIDANSIDTGNEKRDKHLRSADFFDVKKKGYEKLTFNSSSVTSSDGKKFSVAGDLKIAGKSRKVTIDFKYLGSAEAYDVKRVAFLGKIKINRADFGLTWNDGEVTASNAAGKLAEAAGAVGDEVEIEIKLQAKRKADL